MKYWMITLMLLPAVASASAYKCMDQAGGTAYSTAPCDEAGMVPYVEGESGAAGKLLVRKGADGSYRTPGTVNGSPLTFVIDDGNAHTAISPDAARDAGVQCPARTRAGHPCAVTVHEIDLGKFELDHVRVHIMPGLPDDVRIGKDVLRHFRVAHAGDALSVSRR